MSHDPPFVFDPHVLTAIEFRRRDDKRGLEILNACRDEIRARYGEPKGQPITSLSCILDNPCGFLLGIETSGIVIACGGAVQMLDGGAEMKSIYVVPHHRGQGLARRMVMMIEGLAKVLGWSPLRLETGNRQPEAQRLYESMGYRRIPNYGEHAGRDDQFCFEKELLPR